MQAQTLTLRRTFQAPATAIFAAFLSAEALKEWWSPEGFEVVDAQVDARVGGQYRLVLHSQTDAQLMFVHGSYLEITPPTRLVFTHVFDAQSTYPPLTAVGLAGHQTLVTVELHPHGDVTELVLVQEQLPTSAAEEVVQEGWHAILEHLARYIGSRGGVGENGTPSA